MSHINFNYTMLQKFLFIYLSDHCTVHGQIDFYRQFSPFFLFLTNITAKWSRKKPYYLHKMIVCYNAHCCYEIYASKSIITVVLYSKNDLDLFEGNCPNRSLKTRQWIFLTFCATLPNISLIISLVKIMYILYTLYIYLHVNSGRN